jgi:glycerol-3-phosphate O-acyltransferase
MSEQAQHNDPTVNRIAADKVILRILLPASVNDLSAVSAALLKIYGAGVLSMRQTEQVLEIYKPQPKTKQP